MSMFHVKLPGCHYRYIRFIHQPDALYVNICVPPSKVERVLFDGSNLIATLLQLARNLHGAR